MQSDSTKSTSDLDLEDKENEAQFSLLDYVSKFNTDQEAGIKQIRLEIQRNRKVSFKDLIG